jgi:hypothetical protein
MGYTYVSYGRQDTEFVERLVADLRRAQVEVRYDGDSITTEQNQGNQSKEAVREANITIFVMSKNRPNFSDTSEDELRASKKDCIYVVLDEIQFSASVGNVQTGIVYRLPVVNFRLSYEHGFQSLLGQLPKSVFRDKNRIFISYSSKDREFVVRLEKFLRNKHCSFWDYQESPRNHQTGLPSELEARIHESMAVLFVLSPDWKRSIWTRNEYDFSEEIRKPIFRLMFRAMEATYGITNKFYLDFTSDEELGFLQLEQHLRDAGLIA